MKQLLKKKGLVLTSRDYKENARLLTILTENGLENTILRGANKINSKNKAFSITPVCIEYVATSSTTLPTLTEGNILQNYTNIKMDSTKSLIVTAIIEKCLTFIENIDEKTMFFNFITIIMGKMENTQYPKLLLNLFEIKLMYLLGIEPVINHCLICQKVSNSYVMSLAYGGTICKECQGKAQYELDASQTKLFQYLYLIKLDKVDDAFLGLVSQTGIHLDNWIDMYYQKYIDFRSKTKKIIKRMEE